MRERAREWLRRYLPAELVSVVGAVVAAGVVGGLSGHNEAAIAIAGAWGETVAYYATMLVRDFRHARADIRRASGNPSRWSVLGTTLRGLVLEFGVAEALDSLVVRPAMMYAAGQFLGDPQAGVVVGKFAADVVFYVPTIVAYELRRKYVHPRPDAGG